MAAGSFYTSGYDGRCLRFDWRLVGQDIGNNTSTIDWDLVGDGNAPYDWYESGNFSVDIDGANRYSSATRIRLYKGTVVASGTLTLTHDNVGNRSFGAYAQAGIYYYAVNCSGSGSWSLPQIPRQANITSAPNFNDTENPTIGYSNPAGSAVSSLQAGIFLTDGTTNLVPYRDISKTGSSYTFELANQERQNLRYATINSPTLTVRFYVKTVIGGNTFYSYQDKILTIVDADPTFSAAYTDTNSTVTAITQNNQQIVRSQSTLQINVTNLSAKKGATIRTVVATINGTDYTGTVSGTSCAINVGTLNLSSNITAAIKVTDSRAYSTTTELPITILNWELPNAIVTMQRHNNFYTPTDITVDGNYSSVDSKNVMTLKLRYKKVSDSTWSSYTTMQDNTSQTFQLDNNYAWNVQVVVSDLFGSTTYNLTLDRGMPIIYFDRLLSAVGINCFPTNQKSLAINGVDVEKNVMTRNLSSNLTSLTVNTYTKINLSGSISTGSSLTATNDGGIKIGAGVSKILVSGQMLISTAVQGEFYIRICKNSTDNTIGWVTHSNKTTSATFESIKITPVLANVSENDVIYLYYYVPDSSATIYGGAYGNQTSLTVEAVG